MLFTRATIFRLLTAAYVCVLDVSSEDGIGGADYQDDLVAVYEEELSKQLCEEPLPPINADLTCGRNEKNNRYVCTAECDSGFQFPNGKRKLKHFCKLESGKWPKGFEFPDCVPQCKPACQNGGECADGNLCICTPTYRGERCQYATNLCNPTEALNVPADWICNHTSSDTICMFSCPQGTQYESQPAESYHCSLDGIWKPDFAPNCIQINNIESPASHGLYPVFAGQVPKSESSGVCASWKQLHYRTFDGGMYSFQGSCTYLLAKDCVENTFSIHVQNADSCVTETLCKNSITIYIGTEEYVLTNDQSQPAVEWNGQSYPIPTTVNGLLFQILSDYITVLSSLGFRLKWNGMNTVLLKVNSQLKNKTCGLCGRFDGTVLNDFEMSDGTITDNVEVFVNSWTMEQLAGICEHGAVVKHPCSVQDRVKSVAADEVCQVILSSKYSACHYLVDPKPYYEACKMDYCACSVPEKQCICSTLSEYFRECVRLGGKLDGGWRNEELCPLSCPKGMVYEDCGSSCPKTCKKTVYDCEDNHCVDGCHCPTGTLLHNGHCIQKENCPCLHNGQEYNTGQRVTQECNSCECHSGKWECTKEKCEARCSSVGDPHYTTFDGSKYDFLGTCPYYLLYHDDFNIIQENSPCHSASNGMQESISQSEFCTKSIIINYNNGTWNLKPNTEVLYNDKEVSSLPFTENGITVYTATSLFTKVEMSNDMSLMWDGKNRIYIDAPPSLFGLTKGLCGTFNRNQKDDFLTPDGDYEADISVFADRWKASDSCHKRSRRSDRTQCELQPQKIAGAEALCSLLKSEVFSSCHDEVDPESFYRSCVRDLCSCNHDLKTCICPILSDYSSQCAKKGKILDWVDQIEACKPTCEGGQIYQECGNPCKSSCFTIATAENCKTKCVQGCSCPEGTTLNAEGFCIPVDQCPCVYKGQDYATASVTVQGTNICTCEAAVWKCRSAHLTELVKLDPNLMLQDQPLICSTENNEEYSACIEECPPTCQNMHLPQKCMTKICNSGCRCKDGYLLDSDLGKCIKSNECGCRHGGQRYNEGYAIKKDCNLCTCTEGGWKCTEKPCPGICTVWGESHFKSYDSLIYDFHGDCEYILSKGKMKKGNTFTLIVKNVPCGTSGITCSKSFTLDLGKGLKISLSRNEPLPKTFHGSRFVILETVLHVLVYTDIGVSLQWDKGTRLYVTLGVQWRNKVKGLCGNFNDDQSDDFETTSGGMSEALPAFFADSWKVHESCPPPSTITDSCDLHPDRKIWAHQKCGILKSTLFAPCHSEVGLDPYYERCVFDTCACDMGGDCECLCTAIATYAQECNIHGVHIRWRSQELCPIQCEECATYDSCMSSCPQKTCETQFLYGNIKKSCSEEPCIEGCNPKPCPVGQIYNNEKELKCIPEMDCVIPCLEINGKWYSEGDRITDAEIVDSCQSCHCLRGDIKCTGQPCLKRPPIEVPCTQTGWTPWVNTPATEDGDVELLADPLLEQRFNSFCSISNVTDIECRVAYSKIPYKKAGQNVMCSLPKGLECDNRQQVSHCKDYEIRLFCSCGYETTLPTIVTFATNEAYEEKCFSDGWTEWMSEHTPDAAGEHETFDVLRRAHVFCSESEIVDVECRNVITWSKSVFNNVECNKRDGLICKNTEQNKCDDYEIRFYCKCKGPGTTPLPETSPTVPVCVHGWTKFFNIDHPENNTGLGDEETIEQIRLHHSFCSSDMIDDVECKAFLNGEMVDYTETGQFGLKCSKNVGFICNNFLQDRGVQCYDYMIRFHCSCATVPSTPEPPATSTIYPCPEGEVFDKCAIRCNQTCLSFTYQLEDKCSSPNSNDGCIEGCRPAEGCEPPLLWRDYYNCIPRDECTCAIREGDGIMIAPNEVIKHGCDKCQCIDNNLQCYPIPGCGKLTSTIPPSTFEATRNIEKDDCWTEWVNIDTPNIGNGDFEVLVDIRKQYDFCLHPVKIECRDAITHKKASDSGQYLECDLERGLLCYNSVNNVQRCYDFEVRFFCPCATTLSISTTQPTPIFPVAPCENGWTNWYNSHFPDIDGDYETIQSARAHGGYFCANEMIGSVECRQIGSPSNSPLQHGVICDFQSGLRCTNSDLIDPEVCHDYEIRFYCDCPVTGTKIIQPEKPTSTMVPTSLFPCAYWSDWINDNHPSSDTSVKGGKKGIKGHARGKGDTERKMLFRLQQENKFCMKGFLSKIECRDVATNVDYTETGDVNLVCSLSGGFRCPGKGQPSGICRDYKIRYFCSCEETTTAIYIRPTPSTTSVAPCTMFYNLIDGPHPLPDSSLRASTVKDITSSPLNARLSSTASSKSSGSWIAGTMNGNQYIEVDLGVIQPVYGVVTKGRSGSNEWVKSYLVLFSRDGVSFSYVMESPSSESEKVFSGNYDSESPVEHIFELPFDARYVRIQPLTYLKEIALRMDILGCAEGMTTVVPTTTQAPPICVDEMGMKNGNITDSQITVSSTRDINAPVSKVRINSQQINEHPGGWVADVLDTDQYVQVDFYEPRTLTGIVTQGRELVPQWVVAYKVSYSQDGVVWNNIVNNQGDVKVFSGNYDMDTPVANFFPQPIRARLIRINPILWQSWLAMRVEILGCFEPPVVTEVTEEEFVKQFSTVPPTMEIVNGVCKDKMGFENHLLPDAFISVSSSALPWSGVSRIRLNTHASNEGTGSWVASPSDFEPTVWVDFLDERNLTGIITQGREDADMWVVSYTVEYSNDNSSWKHCIDAATKTIVFPGNRDRNEPSMRLFYTMVMARYIKISIEDYFNRPALRLEMLGCFKPYIEVIPPTPPQYTTEYCIQYGPWISLSDATPQYGDEEPIDKIIESSALCTNPLSIQCREIMTRMDYTKTGEDVICDLSHGLLCKNTDQKTRFCLNYEVRIGCWSCEMPTTPTPPLPLSLCPETPNSVRENCPISCQKNYSCDGAACIPTIDCPCFKEGKRFNPANVLVTSDCQQCDCLLGGYSRCKPMSCPSCKEGQKSELSKHCKCDCIGCPLGTVLCPTSGQCIEETLWCDGIMDCPDDEKNCPTTPTPTVTTTTPKNEVTSITCVSDINSEIASCEMNVNTFETFDGRNYTYEICDHMLVKEKDNDYFTVTVHKDCNPDNVNQCRRYIMIYVDDVELKLGPGTEDIKFNGYNVPLSNLWLLSKRFPDFSIKKRGNQLVFRSYKYHFNVVWDSRQDVKIIVTECLRNKLVGLCGFYNNHPSDDFYKPDGSLGSGSEDFGNSWGINNFDRCVPPVCPYDLMAIAVDVCMKLNKMPFKNCSTYVNLASRIDSCISYMCECLQLAPAGKDAAGTCKCQAYESFVEACEEAKGGSVAEWRIKFDCSPECPPGLEWKDCGPGCELTCDNYQQRNEICEESCVPGCYCPAGLIRHHNRCVKPKMCHDCVCRGHGDPNYITFDGHYYAFQGNCTYVLAQHQSYDNVLDFKVLATNYECPEEPLTSCTEGLEIFWNGHVIKKFKGDAVYVDGTPLSDSDSPFELNGISVTFVPGKSTLIHIKGINLAVRYFDQIYGYNIELPAYLYFNKTEGLCGICNFNESDDMYHRDGYITENVEDFAYSWLANNIRENCIFPRIEVPTPGPKICNFTESPCEMFIDPTLYSKSCQNDISYSMNPVASMCRSKFQYAQQCCERGVSLENWLLDSGCSTTCPENMIFECTSACQKTCDNYKIYEPDDCGLMSLLTCSCPPGEVYKLGHCIDSTLCETCDDEGHVVGDLWSSGPCTECQCHANASVVCTMTKCSDPPICHTNETLSVIPPHPDACCNIYQCKAVTRMPDCKQTPMPECEPGESTVLFIENDCPYYKCECKRELCPSLVKPTSTEEEGELVVLKKIGCCQQYVTECFPETCKGPVKCGPGFEMSVYKGRCCEKYSCVPKKNVCAYTHMHHVVNGSEFMLARDDYYTTEYEPGTSWHDGLCTKCSCIENNGQVAFTCSVEHCTEPSEFLDADSYVREADYVPGVCCPKYRRVQCLAEGNTYSADQEWPSPDGNPCKTFRCILGPNGEVMILERSNICDITCPAYAKYVEPEPESLKCCGHCKIVACEENGIIYQVGDTWEPASKSCYTAECIATDNMTQILYRGATCPAFPDNCPQEHIMKDEKGCCSYCDIPTDLCSPTQVPLLDTIQYFQFDGRSHGMCSNKIPITNLTRCAGKCKSHPSYSALLDRFDSSCICCLPHTSVKRTITLDCEDQTKMEKTYQQPTTCYCSSCGQQIEFPSPY